MTNGAKMRRVCPPTSMARCTLSVSAHTTKGRLPRSRNLAKFLEQDLASCVSHGIKKFFDNMPASIAQVSRTRKVGQFLAEIYKCSVRKSRRQATQDRLLNAFDLRLDTRLKFKSHPVPKIRLFIRCKMANLSRVSRQALEPDWRRLSDSPSYTD